MEQGGALSFTGAKNVCKENVVCDDSEKEEIKTEKPKAEKEISEKPAETRHSGNESKELDERVKKFTEVVNHFQKDLDEFRRYAYMEKIDSEDERLNKSCSFDVEFIFRERPEYDFEGLDGDFRKIGLNDLCLIDDYMYKYAYNPTVRAACRKYNHLLLGREDGGLLFCLPDTNRELKEAELLGFGEFKETGKNFGYRIMRIAKETKLNENPKEKLDGRRA
ncbi:MAG: hypothetical protein LUH47_06625 [Clostridiales bacterium]|nr:hypothetical protein [Clostridiales bacterium]